VSYNNHNRTEVCLRHIFLNTVRLTGHDIQGLSNHLRYKTGWKGREITAVKVLDHPAHSPDLTPSDFHLFFHLKKHLAG